MLNQTKLSLMKGESLLFPKPSMLLKPELVSTRKGKTWYTNMNAYLR